MNSQCQGKPPGQSGIGTASSCPGQWGFTSDGCKLSSAAPRFVESQGRTEAWQIFTSFMVQVELWYFVYGQIVTRAAVRPIWSLHLSSRLNTDQHSPADSRQILISVHSPMALSQHRATCCSRAKGGGRASFPEWLWKIEMDLYHGVRKVRHWLNRSPLL